MKAVVFSGTVDGREICEFLAKNGVFVTACVATEYGKEVMNEDFNINVHIGRMDFSEILEFIKDFDFVIDATHPFAYNVTENVRKACLINKIEYFRLTRKSVDFDEGIYFKNVDEAVLYLKNTTGGIFVTTGVKELYKYKNIENFEKRIFARVLPAKESVSSILEYGFDEKNIIFEKGPFSEDKNFEHFKKFNVKYLVTKESGREGGFWEKLLAAKKLGLKVIIIERPTEEEGFSVSQIKEIILQKKKNFKFPLFIDLTGKKVVVIGFGKIACRRIEVLLDFGACVTVVSEDFCDDRFIDKVDFIQREFQKDDVSGAFLVVAATNDKKINALAAEICKEKNIFISVADSSELSTFFFPAVCKGDKICAGVVSNGKEHHLVRKIAKKIRRLIFDYEKEN